MKTAILICVFSIFLTACGTGTDEARSTGSDTVGVSAAAPDQAGASRELGFQAVTVAGDAFDGADMAGKPTVFWFWAPWCPTCRAQISGVSELAETYGSEVNVVGVGSFDEVDAIAEFAGEVSPDVTLLTDPEGAVWRHFGVTAQSTYLVLDQDGRELSAGYLDDAELAELVSGLVG